MYLIDIIIFKFQVLIHLFFHPKFTYFALTNIPIAIELKFTFQLNIYAVIIDLDWTTSS